MEATGLALVQMPWAQSTGPTGRRHLLVLGSVAVALAVTLTLLLTLLLAVVDSSGTRSAVGAARRENGVLRVRQEALRAELFEVARRLETLEPGKRTPAVDDVQF